MTNTNVTSAENILQICRDMVSANGLSSLNMREVAQKCNVALGSLYNYFPSKTDLTIATIE
ncbi:MAG: TetR/AcrR family transcriptional regulator, partial [Clostridiales bacterium]